MSTSRTECQQHLSNIKVDKVEVHPHRKLCRVFLKESLTNRTCFRPIRLTQTFTPNQIIQVTGWAVQNITESPLRPILKVGELRIKSKRHPSSCNAKFPKGIRETQFCGKHMAKRPPCGESGGAALLKNRSGKYRLLIGLVKTRSCEKVPWVIIEDISDVTTWIQGHWWLLHTCMTFFFKRTKWTIPEGSHPPPYLEKKEKGEKKNERKQRELGFIIFEIHWNLAFSLGEMFISTSTFSIISYLLG